LCELKCPKVYIYKYIMDVLEENNKFILNNYKIDDKLHVISVIFNPYNYKKKYSLAKEFFIRMEKEKNVILYIVELAYGEQQFTVTSSTNPRHLQIRSTTPLWHKENLINLGIQTLLPINWKAVAWIDADVEFENPVWATNALKILNGGNDFIQLFTHVTDMDSQNQLINTFTGFGYQYCRNFKKGTGINYWHPGFAWACNRDTYDKIGGLYQEGILGDGDNVMAHLIIQHSGSVLKSGMNGEYIRFITDLQKKYTDIKLGFVPGNIRHYFHGKRKNINYSNREDRLISHQYNPYTFITTNENRLIIPTKEFPFELLKEIDNYFKCRNEDEIDIEEIIMTKQKDDTEAVQYKINYIFSQFDKFKDDLESIQNVKYTNTTTAKSNQQSSQQSQHLQQSLYPQQQQQKNYNQNHQQPQSQQQHYQQPQQQHYQQPQQQHYQQPQQQHYQQPQQQHYQTNATTLPKKINFKNMSFK
jgi:hypothetical protein